MVCHPSFDFQHQTVLFIVKMSANLKQRVLSLSDKLRYFEKYDRLSKMGQREIASKLNILQSVVGRILKNREDIECEALQNESQSIKWRRCGKDEYVKRAMKE